MVHHYYAMTFQEWYHNFILNQINYDDVYLKCNF